MPAQLRCGWSALAVKIRVVLRELDRSPGPATRPLEKGAERQEATSVSGCAGNVRRRKTTNRSRCERTQSNRPVRALRRYPRSRRRNPFFLSGQRRSSATIACRFNPKIDHSASRCRSKGIARAGIGDRVLPRFACGVDGLVSRRRQEKSQCRQRSIIYPARRMVTCTGIFRRDDAALTVISIIRLGKSANRRHSDGHG